MQGEDIQQRYREALLERARQEPKVLRAQDAIKECGELYVFGIESYGHG